MKNKLIEGIVNRLNSLNLRLHPLREEEVVIVEKELKVKLPRDFIAINFICSYEFISFFDTLNFGLIGNQSIVGETKYYREKHNLPHNYLVLSSDGDVSFVLLKIISSEKSEVIWCDYEDFFNLCEGKDMQYNPTIFPSFAAFYEFLLDEEEKIRAGE